MAQTVVDVSSIKDRVVVAAFEKVGETIGAMSSPNLTSAKYNTNNATTDTTLTGANVTGGYNNVVLNMTGVLGAGRSATLPSVNGLLSGYPALVSGQSWMLRVINSSSANFAWTIVASTDISVSGTMTIAQNTWRDFILTVITATGLVKEATLQSVGTGTFS